MHNLHMEVSAELYNYENYKGHRNEYKQTHKGIEAQKKYQRNNKGKKVGEVVGKLICDKVLHHNYVTGNSAHKVAQIGRAHV